MGGPPVFRATGVTDGVTVTDVTHVVDVVDVVVI